MENIKTETNNNTNAETNKKAKAKAKTTSAQRKDYYEEITKKIIKALENNTRPWVQPRDGGWYVAYS